MRVGIPESPGDCQYVCQCGAIFKSSPTVNGLPGSIAVVSATSDGLTRLLGSGVCAPATEPDCVPASFCPEKNDGLPNAGEGLSPPVSTCAPATMPAPRSAAASASSRLRCTIIFT